MEYFTFTNAKELQTFLRKNSFPVESGNFEAGKSGSKSLAMLPIGEWRYTSAQKKRWFA